MRISTRTSKVTLWTQGPGSGFWHVQPSPNVCTTGTKISPVRQKMRRSWLSMTPITRKKWGDNCRERANFTLFARYFISHTFARYLTEKFLNKTYFDSLAYQNITIRLVDQNIFRKQKFLWFSSTLKSVKDGFGDHMHPKPWHCQKGGGGSAPCQDYFGGFVHNAMHWGPSKVLIYPKKVIIYPQSVPFFLRIDHFTTSI